MSPGVVQSKKRSYSREKKLSVVAWYEKNGRNVSATAGILMSLRSAFVIGGT